MEIHSLQEYIDLIKKLEHNYTYSVQTNGNPAFGNWVITPRFIYRGHGDHEHYKVIPGIFRWKKVSHGYTVAEYSQMEYNILNDFISEACRFIPDIPSGDISAWLEIAQHYGVPTRLLDFTQNPLVALYFACSDLRDTTASVWVVNEATYNRLFFNEMSVVQTARSNMMITKIINDEILQQDYQLHNDIEKYILYPWIYKPYYRQERMNSQASIFMLWGANRQEFTGFMNQNSYMCDDEFVQNRETGIICSIFIPANKKKEIIKQLGLCGINEKSIYPGLDGVGRYIKQKYAAL